MSYRVATRTRRQLLSYAACDSLEEAREQLKRYDHIWRIHIYKIDDYGNITIIE